MSELERLIQEYCPNGVEYKTVGDCVKKTSNIKWATDTGIYSYIDLSSVDRDTHKITETQTISADNAPSRAQQIVLEGDVLFGTTRPTLKRYCLIDEEYDGQICSTGFCVLRAKADTISPRWLFHIIASSAFYYYVEANQKGASYPAISDKEVKQFKMPVPPIEVQHEIIRILDNFTELTGKLTVELTAELTARRKQYEHYRDTMLSFTNDTPKMRLGDVCSIKGRIGFRGYTSNDMVEEGQGSISLSPGNIKNHTLVFENCTYITWEKYYESPEIMVEVGDVLLCKTGSTVGKVSIVDYLPEKSTINPQLVVLKNIKCNNRYLKYYLTTDAFQKEIQKRKGLGSVPNISQKELGNIDIPLPTIEEQERIVNILDRFDVLCNDISAALPAEIEARQKQYEYYRDKLLAFTELERAQ